MSYSVDTSALMNAWNRHYPPDVFGAVWKRIEDLVDEGRFLATVAVRDELEKQDDALFGWAKALEGLFVPPNAEIQTKARRIVNDFPSLVTTGGAMRGHADPFVISLAAVRDLTVVCAERSKPSKPRIPDVCRSLGIECIGLVELFRREGWSV